jgi:hypothetical protein
MKRNSVLTVEGRSQQVAALPTVLKPDFRRLPSVLPVRPPSVSGKWAGQAAEYPTENLWPSSQQAIIGSDTVLIKHTLESASWGWAHFGHPKQTC